MTALQASIGILNDVVDAPRDAGHKPGSRSRPVSSRRRVARAGCGRGGRRPACSRRRRGRRSSALALVILAIGYAYDRSAKGTAWSWAPFAVGIPLLPVFAWLGRGRGAAGVHSRLLPAAVLAGAALAIANARADLERDAAAGVASVATALGAERALARPGLLLRPRRAASRSARWSRPERAPASSAGAVAGVVVIGAGTWLGRAGTRAPRARVGGPGGRDRGARRGWLGGWWARRSLG